METFKKYISWLDWTLAFGTIGYGVYSDTWWIMLMGVGGLGIAWFNPSRRVEGAIKSRMTKKIKNSLNDSDSVLPSEETQSNPITKLVDPRFQYYLENPQLVPKNLLDMTPMIYPNKYRHFN